MTRPNVLVCAGLDPSGGAGILADTRVVTALGGRPCGIVTTLTVQNTTGMTDGHVVDPNVVDQQLAFLLSDVEVHAVKIGMLGSAAIAQAIAQGLEATRAPVVWDPVIYPSRGELPRVDAWIADAIIALTRHVTLLTPNGPELEILTGHPIDSLAAAIVAGRRVVDKLRVAVLVKGGHLGGTRAIDVLIDRDGALTELDGVRIVDGEHVHGTGCALSSAIATRLALGDGLGDACRAAKAHVAAKISAAVRPGRGAKAVD